LANHFLSVGLSFFHEIPKSKIENDAKFKVAEIMNDQLLSIFVCLIDFLVGEWQLPFSRLI